LGLIQRIFGLNRKAERSLPFAVTSGSASGVPQYPAASYYDFARGAYQSNAVIYACIQAIVSAFAASQLKICKPSGEEIPNHPVSALFQRPNPISSQFLFWEQWWVNWWLDGNVYPTKVRDGGRSVRELWLLRPDRMRIVPGFPFIASYQHVIDGKTYSIPVEDVMHDRAYNPLNDYFGQSPLLAGLREIATDNEATDFTKITLQNRGVAPGVVLLLEGDQMLGEDEERRAREQFLQKYGEENRGRVGMFAGVKDVKVLSLSMQDLMLPDLRSLDEARICSIFGIPPIVVGVKTGLEHATFANFEEARRMFWQNTIEPLQRRVADLINRRLMPDFDGEGIASFDNSEVSALVSIRNQRLDWALRGLQAGAVKVNEVRVQAGLQEVTGGDVFLRGIATVEVPEGGQPEPAPPPLATDAKPKARPSLKSANIGRIRHALGRSAEARKWFSLVEKTARELMLKQSQALLNQIEKGRKVIVTPPSAAPDHEREALSQELQLWFASVESDWTAEADSNIGQIIREIALESAELAGSEIGVQIGINSDAIQKFVRAYSYKFAERVSKTSVEDIRAIILRSQQDSLSLSEMKKLISQKAAEWIASRAEMIARSETIRAANYGAKEAWQQAGVRQVQWLAADDSCPYCLGLDGKIVGIEEAFLNMGDSYHPEGADTPLHVNYESVFAPPAHPNCTCTLLTVEN